MNARLWLMLLLLAAGPLVAQTFTSTPNVAIPDNDPNGVTNTITVPATSDRIRSLRVGVRITHTYDADLYLFLLPPGVTWAPPYTNINNGPVVEPPEGVITLSTKNGAFGDNYGSGSGGGTVYANFRSSRDPVAPATTSVRSGGAPFTSQAQWIPEIEYEFDNLYGTNPTGDWTLIVVDGWAIDTGTLVGWQLAYTPVTVPSLIARVSPDNRPGATAVIGAADQVLGHYEFEAVGTVSMTSVVVRSENGVVLNTSFSRIALHEDLNSNGVLDPGEGPTLTGTLSPGATTITLSFGASTSMPSGVTRRFLLVGDVLGSPAATGVSMQILQAADFVATASRSGLFPVRTGLHRLSGPRTYTYAPIGGRFVRDNQAFGLRSTIEVPATDDRIGGLRVGIRINHTRDSDIDCFLLPPGVDWHGPYTTGTPPVGAINMTTDNGGNGDNFGTGVANGPYVFTYFSSDLDPTWPTGTNVTAGTAPFTAASGYRPEGQAQWNALYGTNPTGSWTLVVADGAAGGGTAGGTLLAWTLEYLARPKAALSGTQDFGNSAIGVPSAVSPRTFTISNSGDYPLQVTAINFSGAAPGDFSLSPAPTFPFNVPAGGSTNFNASFTPTAQGVRSASLNVTCNDGGVAGSVVPIAVWGFGNMPPSITLNAGFANNPGLPFKNDSTNNVAGQYEVAVGSTGGTINTVTFSEAAGRVLLNNLSALRLVHDADNSGTLTPGDALLATATLNPGSTVASFTVNRALPANSFENWILVADVLATPLNNAIAFRVAGASDIAASMGVTAAFPVDTGPHPIDSARVFTSTPTGGIAIPNASTAGITNSIVIPATTETVAALRVGLRIDHPADQDLDIYLIPPGVTWAGPFTGTGPAGVIELSSDNGGTGANYGSGTDDFVYANLTHSADPVFQPGANIAGQGAGAAPFTSQYYYVEDAADFLARYNTSPAGTWTLAIADDAGDAFTTGRLISWQIEYLPPGTPEITGLANWGGSNVGVVSGLSPQQYSITNIGSINMTATSIALTGTHAGDWAFVGATGTPVVLAPGAQHSVNLSFTPGAVGPRNANLVVTYSTGTQTGLTRTFALSGAGITIPGVISVATPVNFGTVNMGSSSAATPITINNTGAGNLTINSINTTFAGHTGDWSFTGLPSFPHIIAPSGSLVINGTFTPTAAGNRSMTLRITSNTGGVGGSTSDVVLNGFATRGLISVATPVNFGSVSQGSSSAAIPIQINNTGDGPLTLSALNLAFAGHTGDWGFTGAPTPPTVIPAGGNISFNATFTPTAPGARSMTIRITSNNAGVPGTTTDVVLNGTGVALPGQISVSTPVNFGGVNLGSSSAATPIQINNVGTGDLTISALNLAFSGHTTDWGFTGAPTPPTVIPAGGNISFNATFTPTAAGARSMTIRITSNDAGVPGTTTDIVLNGNGLQGLISVTTPVNFGSVNLGSSSAATPITINNVGTGDLTLSALNLAFAGHTADWGFAGAPTPPTVIPAGGNISFNATFTPTAAGARSMTIRVTSNDAGVPGTTTDIVLNGNGLQGLVSVTTPVNFGNVNLGSSSAATAIQINNVGTGDLTLSALNLAFAGHTTDWGFSGAPTPPTVIPAGGNTSFNATFTPTSAGARSMTIRVTSNDAGVPGTTTDIVLNGNGLQGLISVTTPVNFGSVNLGSSSAATPITINNTGTGDLTLSALNLAFAGHAGDWGFTGAPTPPTVIPAGGDISFNATFTPTSAGARSMTIRVTSNEAGVPGATTDIVLNGSGLQGLISVTTPVNFGNVNLGSSSAATPIQINNLGTGDLTISALNLAFTGHTADWGFTGTPTPPTVIPAGGNISFNATFTPTAAGARSMTIRFTSNDAGVPGTTTDIVLNGNGLQGLISVTTPVNFGNVNLGSSSAANPIQINNTGTGDLTISALNLAFAGHTTDWGITGAPTPPTVIPAGGNISFNATFTPTVAGARSMTIRITSNNAGVPGTTTDIVLNGSALQGLISVTTPVNFGNVNLGSSSSATPIQINNVGTGDLTLSALNLAFAGHTTDWGFTGAPTPPTVIPAGGNISFNAIFTPTAAGARSMTIRVTSNDAGVSGTTTDIVLNGNGLQGLISVTTPVNFGNVNLGSSSAATPIQINNTGTGDLTITALNLAFAGHTGDWGFSGAPTPPTVIPAGGNVSFNATFTPTVAGPRSMSLRITSNSGGVPGTTTDITLNGTGTSAVTVTGVTISADTGGPLTVQATVSGTGPVLADIHVNYDRGLGAQAAYILDAPGFVVTGNVIEDVPAGTTLTFRWDAYATERHVTGNYTLTLTPFVGVTPGTSGSALRTLQRQGGWARHSAAVSAPTGVFGHTMVYDSVNDRFVVFAGKRNNIRTNETWVYERNAAYAAGWQRLNIAGTPPSPVQYHNAIYESANERMLVFGGFNDATGYTNELWQLNLTRGSESWQLVGTGSPAFPSARYGSAFIIDEVSERAILFGGIGGTGNMNDAWQLSLAGGGATWAAAAMAPLGTAPTGRWGMAGAFDSVNNRLVLYGGYGPAGQTDEVHELTLGVSPAWSQITPTGTAGARYFASYTHDAAGNTLIVQSGYRSGTILRDVWQLALSGPSAHTWTQLAADDNAGIGRVTGAGAFDTSRDQAAFFGGLGTGGFALTALSLLSTSGAPAWQSGGVATGEYPHGRWGHMLVHDHVGHDRLILWGGKDNSTYFTELWVMDRSLPEPAWVLMSVPGVKPAARVYMAYAYDAAGDRLLVHGGIGASNNTLGDLWELDLSLATPSWTQLASGPAARYLHQVAIDTTLNRMFLFGGWTTTYSSETWSYDLAGNTWTLLAPAGGPPAARQAHGLVYDSSWNRLVAFGGVSAGGRLNDVWALDLTTPGSESWGDISAGGFAMPPTAYFAYAMHPTLTDAYVHGGETSAGASFQMWRLDLSGFNAAWWPVAHGGGIPIERKHHQATFDNLGNLYMGYGYADFQAVADLWVMDSSNTAAGWSDAHNRQAPGGMASAAAAYDPVGNRMIAFGGLTGNAHQGGMFQLDLGSPVAQWTPMDATGTWPSPRRAATMVYDNSSVPPRMILFGGRQGISHTTISNQVWALNLGVTPSWQLLATSANPGPRSNHVAVVAGGFMYVWGGMDQTGAYRNDVRRLNLGTLAWSTVTPSGAVPAARVSPGAVYDAPRDRIVFFGGHTASGTVNQLVELDLGAMAWATLAPGGTVPAARLYHVMVHDAAGQRAVIHGGVLGSAAYADLFTLDLTTDTFTQVAPPVAIPQGRWQHTGVWDEAAGRLAIAGGYVGSGLEALTNGAADTWFWGD